jgi:hypothetical protein
MTYNQAENIVHADPDFNNSALLFVRLQQQAGYTAHDGLVIEETFWSTLILAFIRGYNTRRDEHVCGNVQTVDIH